MPEEDNEIKVLEEELKRMDDLEHDYGVPEQPSKDSIFKFFRELLYLKDSRKIGNLTDREIGMMRLGVRHYLELALFADTMGWGKVSTYLSQRAEIYLATSLSRKGFLPQLFVTQIKREIKPEPKKDEKKPWFKKSEPIKEED